jgi:glycosyltransferase involved in cell wall biosynthesis
VVFQSSGTRSAYAYVPDDRATVIPNPVPPAAGSVARTDRPWFVGVGRLGPEKGFDILLAAFAEVAGQVEPWKLVIWGEGGLRADLLRLAGELGIADRVRLPGRSAEPLQWLAEGGIFVLASRYEGFPNALCEAMAAGWPVIATACSPVVLDLTEEGRRGLVVPVEDAAALARAMERLMADAAERERLGRAARETGLRLAAPAVMARWDDVVATVLGR